MNDEPRKPVYVIEARGYESHAVITVDHPLTDAEVVELKEWWYERTHNQGPYMIFLSALEQEKK